MAWRRFFLHLCLGLWAWLLARVSQRAFPDHTASRRTWILLWFTLSAAWILSANAYYFPHSALGSMHAELVHSGWHGLTAFHAASAAIMLFLAWTVLQVLRTLRATLIIAIAGPALLVTGASLHAGLPPRISGAPPADRPNVIFIGIDALRNDLFDNPATASKAPMLAGFLAQSARFDNAITPLARTFPSWVTIISGKAPRSSGARVNLLPREQVHEGTTLPRALRSAGYASVYAIDEVRFSNLDSSYGFDRAITPPIGASEFLISWFADAPLSNLVVNTWLGRWLFPHVHGNRAAATVYNPDVFIARIGRELPERQPLFLAVHLTLAHWPFAWADSPGTHRNLGTESGDYGAAVTRVDRQFGDLLQLLRDRGLLQNSLVFVFSDHGEALGHKDDLEDVGPLAPQLIEEHHRWGHGSSVLSPAQYRVVLGMRDFRAGSTTVRAGSIDAPVSLEDLTPTAIDLVGAKRAADFDGQSLVPLLRRDAEIVAGFSDRIRFTETEFNPQGVSTRQIARDALQKAGHLYRVDPVTDRVTVREALLQQVAESRQYAAIGTFGKLAALPLLDGTGYRTVYVASNPQAKTPPPSIAERNTEIAALTRALNDHYGLSLAMP